MILMKITRFQLWNYLMSCNSEIILKGGGAEFWRVYLGGFIVSGVDEWFGEFADDLR